MCCICRALYENTQNTLQGQFTLIHDLVSPSILCLYEISVCSRISGNSNLIIFWVVSLLRCTALTKIPLKERTTALFNLMMITQPFLHHVCSALLLSRRASLSPTKRLLQIVISILCFPWAAVLGILINRSIAVLETFLIRDTNSM